MNAQLQLTRLNEARAALMAADAATLLLASIEPQPDGPSLYDIRMVDLGPNPQNDFLEGIRREYWREATVTHESFVDYDPTETYGRDQVVVMELTPDGAMASFLTAVNAATPNDAFEGQDDEFMQHLKANCVTIENGHHPVHFLHGFSPGRNLQDGKIRTHFVGGRLEEMEEDPFMFTPGFSIMVYREFAYLLNPKAMLSFFREELRIDFANQVHVAHARLAQNAVQFVDDESRDAFEATVAGDPRLSGRLLALERRGVLQHVTMEKLQQQNDHANKYRITIVDDAGTLKIQFEQRRKWALLRLMGGAIFQNLVDESWGAAVGVDRA